VRKPIPFFLTEQPQKEPKTAYQEFRACGRDEGYAPSTAPPFEKGGRKLSSCGGRPFGWWAKLS